MCLCKPEDGRSERSVYARGWGVWIDTGILGHADGETEKMPDCECLEGCPFFNDKMPDTEGMGAIHKKRYCRGNYSQCARYMVFKKLGKPRVPGNLYPNMEDRAKKIIAAG